MTGFFITKVVSGQKAMLDFVQAQCAPYMVIDSIIINRRVNSELYDISIHVLARRKNA